MSVGFLYSFSFQLVQDSEGSQRRPESSRKVRKAFETERKDLWELISLNTKITEAPQALLFISQ